MDYRAIARQGIRMPGDYSVLRTAIQENVHRSHDRHERCARQNAHRQRLAEEPVE
jgi:hypothetical protein